MDSKSFFSKGYVQVLMTVVLLGAIASLVSYSNLTLKQAEGIYTGQTTITVQGEGEVLAKPDIGEFSFSVRAEGSDAAQAQELSAEAVNAILAYLEEVGVDGKDIKTQNYNLNPKYRYEERECAFNGYCPPGEPVVDGYEVRQTVTVKVRNLDSSGILISGVGERGATNISSLQFTIDDETVLQAEARREAIDDAKQKAKELAKDLDVRLVRMVGFSEGGGGYYPAYDRMLSDGFAEIASAKSSPSLPVGENSIRSNVSLTYEIR